MLTDTALLRDQQLSPEAIASLGAARQALAAEVGQPLASIPHATAALMVLSDYWTTRVEREPGAFEKARAAQAALVQAMAPLRAQATQQRTSLADKQAEYHATIASIRVLEPGFDEAKIGAAKLGDITLAQLESSVPSRMSAGAFLQLKLDVARQYLTQYQTRAAAVTREPAGTAIQQFIDALRPEQRKNWLMQLIGGPTLNDVVSKVARRDGAITLEGVDEAVRQARVLAPAGFPHDPMQVAPGRFYEVRYDSLDHFKAKLGRALTVHALLPMQIRSADGSRRLDIYRHGGEQFGTVIIDQRDGSAVAQPKGLEAAIVEALGIEPANFGAMVVSYGSSAAVMANKPRLYTSAAEAVQQGIGLPESRSPVSTAPLRRQIEDRTSTPAQRLARLESDYAAFARSLDLRRATSQAGDSASFASLRRSASRLRDATPGVVGQRAGRIAELAAQMWYADLALRGFVSDGLLSPEAARGSIEAGLTAVDTVLRRHGTPEGFRVSLDNPSVLRFVFEMWDTIAWNVNQGYACNLPELDALAQAQRVEVVSTPLRFLEWLVNSAADWRRLAANG